MTARRGAPSSCANASCTMLHIFPLCRWMPHISGCLVFWRDDGLSGCTVKLCKRIMHHTTYFPTLQVDAGSRVQLQYFCVEEMQHASPTLPVDAPSCGRMTARWGAPSSWAICNVTMLHATPTCALCPATICVIDALRHLRPATAPFVLTYCFVCALLLLLAY